MSLTSEIIDAMLESGCTVEQLAAVIKATLRKQAEEINKKRDRARLRKQKQRERKSPDDDECHTMSHDVTGTERDNGDVTEQKIKRKEPKEKQKNNNINIIIPPYIPPELWQDFEEHRAKLRKPMTSRAKQEILGKLEKFRLQGYSPPELLKSAIEHGWLTIYEPRNENGTNRKQRKTNSERADDAVAEFLAEQGIEPERTNNPPGPPELRHLQHIRERPGSSEEHPESVYGGFAVVPNG